MDTRPDVTSRPMVSGSPFEVTSMKVQAAAVAYPPLAVLIAWSVAMAASELPLAMASGDRLNWSLPSSWML